MKLSVITICYNQSDIEETCESIINQSFQDFEWIVVDGGSTDQTLERLEKYKNRINVLISEKDNGRYDAMNKGIKLAKGEWINFLNGGDRFFDNMSLQNVFLEKEYEADILYGYLNMEQEDKNQVLCTYPKDVGKDYLINSSIGHPASFIKKELFNKYGLYEEKYQCIADWEKWICFFINSCKLELIPQLISIYKSDGITFSSSKKVIEQNLKDRREIFLKYFSSSDLPKLIPYEKKRLRLFGFIPFIKIFKYLFMTKIYLFEIPIIKIKTNKF